MNKNKLESEEQIIVKALEKLFNRKMYCCLQYKVETRGYYLSICPAFAREDIYENKLYKKFLDLFDLPESLLHIKLDVSGHWFLFTDLPKEKIQKILTICRMF